MRFFVIKQDTTLKTLGQRLFTADHAVALERLHALNPHLPADRLEPGTVVLVPDSPGLKDDDADTVGGFSDFASEVGAAVNSGIDRARADLTQREQQGKELGKTLRSAALQNLAKADTVLRKRIDESAARISADNEEAKAILASLETLEAGVTVELGKLRKLAT